jgi:hypothetical protein
LPSLRSRWTGIGRGEHRRHNSSSALAMKIGAPQSLQIALNGNLI